MIEVGTPLAARVHGQLLEEWPRDLYIPPEALEVFLDAFEGPLDLLLYLIRRERFDILDIPIAQVTHQYLAYIALMKEAQLELAGEYLVMAAMLAEIKSRMLLPKPEGAPEEEEDPRAQLIRRLQEYERYRQVAEDLDNRPRLIRDLHVALVEPPDRPPRPDPQVRFEDLMHAFALVLARSSRIAHHQVRREVLSVRERMTEILGRLSGDHFISFSGLFAATEGRLGVVVTFLALLELLKESLVVLVQTEPFAPIHVRPAAHG